MRTLGAKTGVGTVRNKVQVQKSLSEAASEALYGTEEQSRAVVMASRWPDGFECPACVGRTCSEVTSRRLFQCSACRRQTPLVANTIFVSTHLPLRLLFYAVYDLIQSKRNMSSIELRRHLGVTQILPGRSSTCWRR